MSEEAIDLASSAIPTKTYVRGTFLFSTDDGTGYEQKNRNRVEDQIMIEDKANLGSLKRQIQSKKQEMTKKKQKAKKQKQMLIPIRDTPVEPLPEPMMDNNKCERATQQQFQYFQTYISQKQKQKKFEEEQQSRIYLFQRQQDNFRKNQQNQERKGISIVLQKDDKNPLLMNKNISKKKGPMIKVVIKKKDQNNNGQIANKSSQNKNTSEIKNTENEVKQQAPAVKNSHHQKEEDDEGKLETFTKVRVVQQQQE